jgi:hypothetical protein
MMAKTSWMELIHHKRDPETTKTEGDVSLYESGSGSSLGLTLLMP